MQRQYFNNTFSETIFKAKYANGPTDTWGNLAERVVEDVCGSRTKHTPLMSLGDRQQLVEYIKDFKFVPGGRYLWYAGRKNHYYNNCGDYHTKLLTDKGWIKFGEHVNKEVNLLSPVDGEYKPATIYSHGLQDVYEYLLVPLRGKSKIEYKIRFTENHKWLLKNGMVTENLSIGDVLPANIWSLDNNNEGFAHGFVFGDGNNNGQLRLCAEKDIAYLERLTTVATSVSYPEFANGNPCLYFKQGRNKWKELPTTTDPEYIASFIMGWIAADGHNDRLLCSINKQALEWFREHAAYAGLVIIGDLRYQDRDVTIGEYTYNNHRIYIQNWCRGEAWQGFKVLDKKFIGHQEVFCPFEPEYNQIIIDHGIHTFNCYLLRAEYDTREEWADLTQRAVSCLMTGGGIGIDYSILRPSGKPLSRTGGLSSGPIPLMQMINEVGRGVMQGGSRRSAIYASLNWQHEDIPDFLKAKNWTQQVREIKEQDFNFPAPLDMTNISVNYDDTAFGSLSGNNTGFPKVYHTEVLATNPIFLENCKQAMKTGEPGFSFNFGNKQNETLRNACTEVTSEDDSDVCNLGSINLSNIKSLEEFKSVCQLGAKFLICGSLRADLPYEKVYKVREKNRRIGLGLMGIHAWLLQRGYKYDVVPELHEWLKVYKDESERAANEHCDHLYISKPVAYRAIAPTGTIGILAGTTTGIEPLFAVAYKRRYLTNGTKWKHEFVIDSTADLLIKQYEINPSTIETAYGLSTNYEQRIKFQADIQDYVDMSISSTINLPAWGTNGNSEKNVSQFANTLARYAPRLRGFTCYPDGSRGGQPLTEVPYEEALKHKGITFEENVDRACTSGVCGV